MKTTHGTTTKNTGKGKADKGTKKVAPKKAPQGKQGTTSKAVTSPAPKKVEQAAPVTVTTTKQRDPRLPAIGTPIMKVWRTHQIAVTEVEPGAFKLVVDGKVVLTAARTLTACAAAALRFEGVETAVNGYAWFRVGTPEAAPRRTKDPLVSLRKAVAKAQARFDALVKKVAEAETALQVAEGALTAAQDAAQEPAA